MPSLNRPERVTSAVVEPSELRDLSPDRFGVVVAAVVAHAWEGEGDVSPPSPDGAVDAVIRDGGEDRLLHARQGSQVDADAVRDVSRLASERGFHAAVLVTTGTVTDEAHAVAREADVELLDGGSFVELVEGADVEPTPAEELPVATLVTQLTGHWPGRIREVAVELATTIEDAAAFDRELTKGSERTDVDFLAQEDGRVVARMRFLRTSLLVYVRRGEDLDSVLRLTAHRSEQPSVRELEADLQVALEGVLGE